MKKSAVSFGCLLILAAGILWGLMGVFVRKLNVTGFDSLQIVWIRSVVTLVLMGIFLFFFDRKAFKIRLKDIWCFIGTGLVSIVMFTYFYFRTITSSTLSTAAVLLYTAPIFVMFLSALLFHEKITAKKLLACSLAFLGCVCVSGILGGENTVSLESVITGLLSGIGYALYSIFSRYALNKGYSSFVITFYTFLIATVCVAPFCHLPQIVSSAAESTSVLTVGILMGIVTAAIPYVCYTMGLKYVEAGKASTMASIEPVVATLIGVFFFRESLTLAGILGILLVLSAIVLLNLKTRQN